ncbi:hypothetical protein WMY93_006559 [Mugilogobius chulae]|uniref:Immunoglobulin domain-containing protein n=1 Tax=Mugilogobius chulae TaxID=88201 RepID=A0AAW0PNP7_9GOBI
MKSVHLYFINTILILGGFWAEEVEAISLSAEEGENLQIKCSHSYAQGNVKYFCKKSCSDRDVLIRSDQKDQNSRYSITDTGNIFYVTISDLKQSDTDEYYCGVERVGKDTYTYVIILVKPRTESSPNAPLQNNKSETFLYIGVCLGALLFILLIAVVIFTKHRHRNSKTMAGGNMTLSDPSKSSQQTSKNTRDIYANVQTDEESYSSVIFTKHREGHVTRTDPESTVYSQVI